MVIAVILTCADRGNADYGVWLHGLRRCLGHDAQYRLRVAAVSMR